MNTHRINHRINLNDLTTIKVLGEGSYGKVTLEQDNNGKKYVVKKIAIRHKQEIQYVLKEIDINKLISEYPNCHPNVTCLYDYFIDQDNMEAVIVYVYLEGYYDLIKLLINLRKEDKIDFNLFNKLFRNVIKAVKDLHDKHIIHRDIKEINILTNDNGDIQIIDFGISSNVPPDYNMPLAGTPGYIDPYVFNKNNCFISDTYAIATMFYKFLTKAYHIDIMKYYGDDYDTTKYKNSYSKVKENIDKLNFPSQYYYYNTLLKHMLNPFGIRPSINEISDYLKNNGKYQLKINDYKDCIKQYPHVSKNVQLIKPLRKTSRKISPKPSKKISRKVSRKTSPKPSRKVSRKPSRKTSRKPSRKTSRKSRKTSRKVSRKVSRKSSRKTTRKSRKSRKSSRKTSRKVSRK